MATASTASSSDRPKAEDRRRRVGRDGEALAERHLISAGYQILARNWRCTWGEVDIVARDKATLVFVEVRTRTTDTFGSPEESITAAKAQRMARCALEYLGRAAGGAAGDRAAGRELSWRIDLVAVELAQGAVKRLDHLRDVLQ